MYLLKQKNLDSKTFNNATVKDVVSYVAPDENVIYDDADAYIGDFQIDNNAFINAVSVFEVLNKQFVITSKIAKISKINILFSNLE